MSKKKNSYNSTNHLQGHQYKAFNKREAHHNKARKVKYKTLMSQMTKKSLLSLKWIWNKHISNYFRRPQLIPLIPLLRTEVKA